MPTLDLRICYCGKAFMPQRKWQIHCSNTCRAQWWHIRRAAQIAGVTLPDPSTPLPHPVASPEAIDKMEKELENITPKNETESPDKGLGAYKPNVPDFLDENEVEKWQSESENETKPDEDEENERKLYLFIERIMRG